MDRFDMKAAINRVSLEVKDAENNVPENPNEPKILDLDIPEKFDDYLSQLLNTIEGDLLRNICTNLKINFLTIEPDNKLKEKVQKEYNLGNNKRKRVIRNLLIETSMEGMR